MSPSKAPVHAGNTVASSRELVPVEESESIVAERERIADELRAGTMHALFGIGLELTAIAATTSDEATAERLQGSVKALDRAIAELRRHVHGLGPEGDLRR
jgi:signal transduction histidine kinase